jgi:hypothetical protein
VAYIKNTVSLPASVDALGVPDVDRDGHAWTGLDAPACAWFMFTVSEFELVEVVHWGQNVDTEYECPLEDFSEVRRGVAAEFAQQPVGVLA